MNVRWLGMKCNMFKDTGGLFCGIQYWDLPVPMFSPSILWGKQAKPAVTVSHILLSKLVCWVRAEVQH